MNPNNLIPNTRRSPSELREMGRKGGIASGVARRKKRDSIKAAKMWMQIFNELERKDKAKAEKVLKALQREYGIKG